MRVLEIPTFQLINNDDYAPKIDITDITNNSYFQALERFSLSDNSITTLSSGFTHNMKSLKDIDLSNNILLGIKLVPLFLELVVHPELSKINFEMQGFIGGSPGKNLEYFSHEMDFKQINMLKKRKNNVFVGLESSWINDYLQLIGKLSFCWNNLSLIYGKAYNVSILFCKDNLTTELVTCMIPGFAPKIVLPDLRDIYNSDCTFNFEMPIGKDVQQIYIIDIHLEKSNAYASTFTGMFCMQSGNILKKVNASSNAKWLRAVKLQKSLDSLTSLSGLDALEILDISNNNLNIKASFFAKESNLPGLKEFHCAGNCLNFSSSDFLCEGVSNLEFIDLSNNGIKCAILEKYFTSCSKLSDLDLSKNMLNDMCFDVPFQAVKYLDLSYNTLAYFYPETVNHLNNLYHSESDDIYLNINLLGNPLACDCRVKNAINFIE